jgi:glycosyltransferase involved in cell wall biosynthesis
MVRIMSAEHQTAGMPAVSVVLPASNEASLIGPCLRALCASRLPGVLRAEVIVVANGCRDDTADRARAEIPTFEARGWDVRVIEQAHGNKLAALNAGDAVARHDLRVYLDADVTVSPDLLAQLVDVLERPGPRYASGRVVITARSVLSRAYARFWQTVPFMRQGVPGCGLFAVNGEGRARWGRFPEIISDDTFVRLSFAPGERAGVAATYDWPIAEGFGNLVRVRRRQNAGVAEIEQRYPELLANDDKPTPTRGETLAMALRDPPGFAVYAAVALAVKLRPQAAEWSRGR